LYRYLAKHAGKIFLNIENKILQEKIPIGSEVIGYGKSENSFCSGAVQNGGDFLSLVVTDITRNSVKNQLSGRIQL